MRRPPPHHPRPSTCCWPPATPSPRRRSRRPMSTCTTSRPSSSPAKGACRRRATPGLMGQEAAQPAALLRRRLAVRARAGLPAARPKRCGPTRASMCRAWPATSGSAPWPRPTRAARAARVRPSTPICSCACPRRIGRGAATPWRRGPYACFRPCWGWARCCASTPPGAPSGPTGPTGALLATALVAFLPQFLFIHAAVSNDAAITFFSAAALVAVVANYELRIRNYE
jgi:hypothetical protein